MTTYLSKKTAADEPVSQQERRIQASEETRSQHGSPREQRPAPNVDEVLVDSFPASDPPSWTSSISRVKPSLIVHPVSDSPSGKAALATAVALARVFGADLHVLELTGRRRSSRDPIVRAVTDDVGPRLAEFGQSVDSADVKISAVELVGDVVDAVAAYARSASADLVVVADHARSHGPYWRRGMYASDLARHLSTPLLTVPASGKSASVPSVPFTRILTAIDLSASSMTAVEHALSLARQTGAKVTFLHIDETLPREAVPSEEAKSYGEAMTRSIVHSMLAASSDVVIETLVISGPIGEGIVKSAAEVGADLIVMGRPGARYHVSMNSPLAHVLRKAPRPVLVVPATSTDRIRVPLDAVSSALEPVITRSTTSGRP